MFFQPKPIISDDMADWIVDSFAWELAHDPAPRRLIQPTAEFIAATKGDEAATARAVLHDVCRHLGSDRPFKLEPLPELPDEWSHDYGRLAEVAGTYEYDAQAPVIRYSAKSMARPVGFINTMAHEIMHDRLHPHEADLPGGTAAHELSTDLHCIFLGFGLFQLAAAEQLGWSGYMSQPSRAYALALFLGLWAPDSQAEAFRFLPPRAAKLLKQAGRMARLEADLARLRAHKAVA